MANAQAAPPPTYLHDIPSIHATNPGIPAVLGNLDLNCAIQTGHAIDPQNIVNATSVAKGLRATHGEFQLWLEYLSGLFYFIQTLGLTMV